MNKKPTLEDYRTYLEDLMKVAKNENPEREVPKSINTNFEDSDLRVYAYYLPQFHAIKENDAFWGTGFTEWTNVTKAVPQFIGHHQPQLPADLGFYNLSNLEDIRKQVDLAKSFGVSGFCFHYYWFSGKRVLEKPVDLFFENKDLDLGFFLCWANENWTRRWDGFENDVLLSQSHHADDYSRIFNDWLPLFKDQRYLKTPEGCPIVMVYRPAILKDAVAAAKEWRRLAVEAGLPGIYLITSNSFSQKTAKEIGFDALAEFPPHGIDINPNTFPNKIINENYEGSIYDFGEWFNSERFFSPSVEPTFKAVFPGWDNEARKPGRGHSFINLTPNRFHNWMRFAARNTLALEWPNRRKLLLINAWNEWAEGAHLEPDQKYGYAYLNRVARTIEEYSTTDFWGHGVTETADCPTADKKCAVILHLYYLDLYPYFKNQLMKLPVPFNLYVTVPVGTPKSALNDLRKDYPDAFILPVENRGRDVAPFLRLLKETNVLAHEWILKLYTKKSPHRVEGNAWRTEIVESLVSCDLYTFKEIDLLVPRRFLLNYSEYIGSNSNSLERLNQKLTNGLIKEDFKFPAGSMYWAKSSLLKELNRLELNTDDFEVEDGQIDGTVAHAVERVLGIICKTGKFIIESI